MSKPVPGVIAPPEHQREVDALVAAVKADPSLGKPSIFRPAPERLTPSCNELDHRMAEELQLLQRRLQQLSGILAGDPLLLARHSGPLQGLDLMNQVLGQLADVVSKEDKAAAVDRISLRDLKARLQRQPLRPLGFN